jgi:hypothetical protein
MDASIFAAVADLTRLDLVMNLAGNNPKTATQLAEDYPITRLGILKTKLIIFRNDARSSRYSQ